MVEALGYLAIGVLAVTAIGSVVRLVDAFQHYEPALPAVVTLCGCLTALYFIAAHMGM